MRFKDAWHFLRDIGKDTELLQIGNRTIDVALPGLSVEGDVVNYRSRKGIARTVNVPTVAGRSSVDIVTPPATVGAASQWHYRKRE
jgi:hypothetical protein